MTSRTAAEMRVGLRAIARIVDEERQSSMGERLAKIRVIVAELGFLPKTTETSPSVRCARSKWPKCAHA